MTALAFNQAWCIAVAIACDLLAWLRLVALDHHLRLRRARPATVAASTYPPEEPITNAVRGRPSPAAQVS